MACQHPKTRALYEQRPPSEGRKLARVGSKCEACGQLLPSTPEAGGDAK